MVSMRQIAIQRKMLSEKERETLEEGKKLHYFGVTVDGIAPVYYEQDKEEWSWPSASHGIV